MKKLALTLPGDIKIEDRTEFADRPVTDIVSELLQKYIFYLAGIILLFFLIWGGFDLLTSGGDPKKVEAGKQKLTNAIVGFIIIFIAYWIVQLLEEILGIGILKP